MTRRLVIGLSGYARSGKDTVAVMLVERCGFVQVGFADALREMALAIDPFVEVGNQQFNRLTWIVETYGWDSAKQHADVRRFLQRLGTEGVRETLSDRAWIDAWQVRAEPLLAQGSGVVIPDVRFQNEARMLYRLGGQCWRIRRPGIAPVNAHASETGLDEFNFDREIYNDGALEDLWKYVDRALHGRLVYAC